MVKTKKQKTKQKLILTSFKGRNVLLIIIPN